MTLLEWLNPYNYTIEWGRAADMATTLGLAVGAVAALLALMSYRGALQAASHSHVHTVFQEYLRLRFDYRMTDVPDHLRQSHDHGLALNEGPLEQVIGAKLYALEAMYEWVWRRQRRNRLIRIPVIRDLSPRENGNVEAWAATIRVHARQEPMENLKSMRRYSECYSIEFLEFVLADWRTVFPAEPWTGELEALVRREQANRWSRPQGSALREIAEEARQPLQQRSRPGPSAAPVAGGPPPPPSR